MKSNIMFMVKGIQKIDQCVDYLTCILMGSILILTISNVFLRYVLSAPIKWYEELVVLLIVWLCMLGLSVVYRHSSHIYIDLIDSIIPPHSLSLLKWLVDIFIIAILVAMIVLGIRFSIQAFVKLTNILRIPYFYIDLAVPVGAALGILDIFAKRCTDYLGEE